MKSTKDFRIRRYVYDEHFDAGSGLDKFEIKVYLGMNLWDLSLQLKVLKKH